MEPVGKFCKVIDDTCKVSVLTVSVNVNERRPGPEFKSRSNETSLGLTESSVYKETC